MRITVFLVVIFAVTGTIGTTVIAASASRTNYPGAAAMEALHRAVDEDGWSPDKVGCLFGAGGAVTIDMHGRSLSDRTTLNPRTSTPGSHRPGRH